MAKNNWKPIINKFQSKLSNLKADTLLFVGQLTLIKSVLGSLPTYYISLYKEPIGVWVSRKSLDAGFFREEQMKNEKSTGWIRQK